MTVDALFDTVVGLDLGGTFLKGALIDGAGRVVDRLREPLAKESRRSLTGQLAAAVGALDPERRSQGVGIGVPGIMDVETGRVLSAPSLEAMEGMPVGEEMTRITGRPSFAENGAHAAALAEAWQGAGRDAEYVLYLTLGTGVAGGLVFGGRLWTGRYGYAGEIGHLQVQPSGLPCACGSRGCLETIAGSAGWARSAEALMTERDSTLRGRPLDPASILECAREGDAVALDVVDGVAQALGTGVAAALDLLNLDRVVLGCGASASGDLLLQGIVEHTRRRSFPHVFASTSFRLAELGGDAGVVGAARVAMTRVGS